MSRKNRIVFAIGALSLLVIAFALVMTGQLSADGRILPEGMPSWFKNVDQDEEGQVAFYDQFGNRPVELRLHGGRAKYHGALEEAAGEFYKGKKFFKFLTIRL